MTPEEAKTLSDEYARRAKTEQKHGSLKLARQFGSISARFYALAIMIREELETGRAA